VADLQTSQPHFPRELVSGKLGWGWIRAAKLIAANFLVTAGFILFGATERLSKSKATIAQLNQTELNAIVLVLVVVSLVLSRPLAKSVLATCRQNLAFRFPKAIAVGGTLFGLVLGIFLGIKPLQQEPQILDAPLTIALISAWWVVFATLLLSTAFWLWIWVMNAKSESLHLAKDEMTTLEHLSVITYSDQTVLLSPTALTQQPRQFSGVVVLILSLFFWTMVDFSIGLKAFLTIAIAASGLTGTSTWQIHLQPQRRIFALNFSGLWGLGANYTINLESFSRLAHVKMQESGGEISWMQLAGNSTEITLPSAITVSYSKKHEDEEDELGKVLREKVQLARHDTTRDSLGLVGVLLPQGAGILAGLSLLVIGAIALFMLPLPERMMLEGSVILLGVCLVSPAIARYALSLVAPSSLAPDRDRQVAGLQFWEIGAALAIAAVTLPSFTQGFAQGTAQPLLFLACSWLSFSVGACILTLTRRTPIVNKM
jgi:hypothetical protein